MKKPEWLKVKTHPAAVAKMQKLLSSLSLHTVCENASCPNEGECFNNKTATFMILGNVCTRNCTFCTVTKGNPTPLDEHEPENVAEAAKQLGLKHIVVTSVTRDDLPDGGAAHFKQTVLALKNKLPNCTTEVLIPDFQGDEAALETVLSAEPDILNHNIETVPALYSRVRPMADYQRSLELLKRAKAISPGIYTKSGIMVGLGETEDDVLKSFDDLRASACDVITIGQYLRPSREHLPVVEYITPEQFKRYEQIGLEKGFSFVASGPLVRSSYNAAAAMDTLKGR